MSIALEGVSKGFGGQQVLRDVTLRVAAGERMCFFGPSGCGKTTLLRLITGLDVPDSGCVTIPKGTRFACHFQEDRLLPWYTARENLRIVLGDGAAADRWLGRVGLADAGGKYPCELSGGMRRRVSLARALGWPADVLVLDEPLRELDADNQQAMLRLVEESIADRTLLLVTHDRTQAEALRCRIIAMPEGIDAP